MHSIHRHPNSDRLQASWSRARGHCLPCYLPCRAWPVRRQADVAALYRFMEDVLDLKLEARYFEDRVTQEGSAGDTGDGLHRATSTSKVGYITPTLCLHPMRQHLCELVLSCQMLWTRWQDELLEGHKRYQVLHYAAH